MDRRPNNQTQMPQKKAAPPANPAGSNNMPRNNRQRYQLYAQLAKQGKLNRESVEEMEARKQKQQEEVKIMNEHIDFYCTICYEIMVEPCSLPCNHRLCLQCTKAMLKESSQCPYDRVKIPNDWTPEVDDAFIQQIKDKLPEVYAKQETILQEQFRLMRDAVEISFVIGNEHERVRTNGKMTFNKHNWTAFVRCADPNQQMAIDQVIQKVRFGLDGSFGVQHMDLLAGEPFELSGSGHSWFKMPITIFFQPQLGMATSSITFDHMLTIEGKGKSKTVSVFLNENALKLFAPDFLNQEEKAL